MKRRLINSFPNSSQFIKKKSSASYILLSSKNTDAEKTRYTTYHWEFQQPCLLTYWQSTHDPELCHTLSEFAECSRISYWKQSYQWKCINQRKLSEKFSILSRSRFQAAKGCQLRKRSWADFTSKSVTSTLERCPILRVSSRHASFLPFLSSTGVSVGKPPLSKHFWEMCPSSHWGRNFPLCPFSLTPHQLESVTETSHPK